MNHPNSGDAERFLRNVRALRKASGIDQEILARRIGRPRDFVSRLERGLISVRLEDAIDVAAALGCTLPELLGDFTLTDARVETARRDRQVRG